MIITIRTAVWRAANKTGAHAFCGLEPRAAPPLAANVSIHGSFRDHAPGWAKNAKGRFLILHGADDEGYPLSAVDKVVQELRGAKVPFQLEVYSGTGHGFSSPKGKDEERANARSIATTAETLKELFGI